MCIRDRLSTTDRRRPRDRSNIAARAIAEPDRPALPVDCARSRAGGAARVVSLERGGGHAVATSAI